jgi:hypothetical protein
LCGFFSQIVADPDCFRKSAAKLAYFYQGGISYCSLLEMPIEEISFLMAVANEINRDIDKELNKTNGRL